MSFEITCTSSQSNTGIPRCKEDLGYPKKFIFVPRGTEITTEALANTKATWTTLFNAAKADRGYPFPVTIKNEPAANEPVYEELIGGRKEFVALKAGQSKYSLELTSLCYMKKLMTFNNGTWAVYIIDSNGRIWGLTDSTGLKFLPQDCFLRVDSPEMPTDASIGKIPVTLQIANPTLFNEMGVSVKPTAFDPETELLGLQDVTLTAGAITATTWVMTVKTTCDLVEVSGLVAGDFLIATAAAPTVDITHTTVESPDGTYTHTYATQSGALVCNLKNQPAMTTKGYEAGTTNITATIV